MEQKNTELTKRQGVFTSLMLVSCCLLTGCQLTPVTTQVSKTQDFTPSPVAMIHYAIVPHETIKVVCENADLGCVKWKSATQATIFVSDMYPKYALEHEFDHVVYGPLHIQ